MSFMKLPSDINRPVALLTGATGGIGVHLVQRLVSQGYHILAVNRAGDFQPRDHVTPVACDIAQNQQIEALADGLRQAGVTLAALIHCAGVINPQRAGDYDIESASWQLRVNLEAPVFLTTLLLPLMPAAGHIIFINSMAALVPLAGSSIYTASKFGLRGYALALAQDVQPLGLRVSSVFPGAVDTPMLQKEIDSGGSPLNFVTAPSSPDEIACIVQRLLLRPKAEIFCPSSDGVLAQLMLIMPRVWRMILPVLMKKGLKGKKKYLARGKV